jgi:two-component system, chemotaxis family, response regulator Rcp1
MEILLVENNPADARLVQEALRPVAGAPHLSVARDGQEALAFLRRQDAYAAAPRPDLILLDLDLPKKQGLDVLAAIKQDRQLQAIPVVVLTTSEATSDIRRSYELAASACVLKPVDLDPFLTVIQTVAHFWGRVALLPRRGPAWPDRRAAQALGATRAGLPPVVPQDART